MANRILTLFFLLLSHSAFAVTVSGQWLPGIVEPSVLGLVAILLYILVAIRCVYKASASKVFGGNDQLWFYLAAFLLLLAINKQFDLQGWVAQTIKQQLIAYGLFDDRDTILGIFVAVAILSTIIVLFNIRVYLASIWRNYKLAYIGIILLCLVISLNVISNERLSEISQFQLMGASSSVWIEICALLLISLSSLFKNKTVFFKHSKLSELSSIVDIAKDGDLARCPQCGTQGVSKTEHDRKYKCRKCGYVYRIRTLSRV
jgi:ribosomal protein S27AE